ncbi:response regulator [Methanospirillum lacunae]|uniref:Histidine kinase n=1 Tax=Methanospirillum lacunae TaxID=668570 RepID=A0A2V2N1Y8_9EURY|nr:response regulator [Methanospirillum lacunae]PWR72650.1 hypothetical protein DK846_06700 [Methanospirillum lacunae]
MRVLVVDDQYINRYLLEKILEGHGLEVVSAIDGIDAFEKVQAGGIDLIISDVLYPRMDGFQFCREIKSNPAYKHIPFVFYTAAYTEEKDQEFAFRLGADRYILKPTDPSEFINIIKGLIAEYPELSGFSTDPALMKEEQYLSEHNKRLFHQLEKKLIELEELNQALRRSEERYRNLFENVNDAIILHEILPSGEPGRILEVNTVACKRLGYSREEMLEKKISDIETPESAARYREIQPDAETARVTSFEGEQVAKDGTVIPVEINAHLYHENGMGFCLSVCRDITVRKKAMNELSRALSQINRNIYQMATIGDKIRNPLAIIVSTCEECRGERTEVVHSVVQNIDEFISELDQGWVESEKVRAFLQKQYGIGNQEMNHTKAI